MNVPFHIVNTRMSFIDLANDRIGLVVPEELVEVLAASNWNVKTELEPPILLTNLRRVQGASKIELIKDGEIRILEREEYGLLDQLKDIARVDARIAGWEWKVNKRHGIKAYILELNVTVP